MTLTRVRLENFTAFAELDLELSSGINVLVGANGTGKTHLMKVCYAACEVSRVGVSKEDLTTAFVDRLIKVFLPSGDSAGRFVREKNVGSKSQVEVYRSESVLGLSILVLLTREASRSTKEVAATGYSASQNNPHRWSKVSIQSAFIPTKEMLSNAPGFRSLYAQREIHFEEVYADVLDRAYLPPLRKPYDRTTKHLLGRLERAMGGEVSMENEEFFMSGERGDIEFTLLAEGMRKLGLLWLLIRNGSLRKGAVLFWDEPETNLNPKMYGVVMDVLLELQRGGVQIFFATHDYGILKELELRMREGDEVEFHSLYHDEDTGEIACNTARRYLDIHPNAIEEAFEEIYDRQIERSLGDFGR